MSFLEILGIAIGLSMDAFAVSLGAGATVHGQNGRARFRLSFHFGLFQALMPIAGWLLGTSVAGTSRRSIIGSRSRCWRLSASG
jgi:putative Mn2+ efflux pump MntP